MVRVGSLSRFIAGIAIGFAVLIAPPSYAQEAGQRRIVTTEGADYFGRDYDILKDVDLERCTVACLGDDRCKAFTLNTRSQWCFLKEEIGELRTVAGAVSGKVVVAAALDENSVEQRAAGLDFLPRSALDEAKRLRLEIAEEERDAAFDDQTVDDLARSATAALTYPDAIRLWREALKREPLAHRAWQDIAEAALAYNPEQYGERPTNDRLREFGAINAYLTAASDDERAEALRALGSAYEAAENWKLSIKSYRRSLDVAETRSARARLDAVVAEHGFRIVDNAVDNNAAKPRICLNFSDALSTALTSSENAGDYVRVENGETLPVTASGSQICVDGVKHG
ncbi:MAG TPA: PAN/Apple domain-containing protein, partial [Aurantimonas sp.]